MYLVRDQGGIWTIGYGTILYPNGKAVKERDTCTTEQASSWLKIEADKKAKTVDSETSRLQKGIFF